MDHVIMKFTLLCILTENCYYFINKNNIVIGMPIMYLTIYIHY